MSEKWFEDVTPLMVARCSYEATGINYSIFLEAEDIHKAALEMKGRDYHLEDVSAAHFSEGYLLTYHFSGFSAGERIVIRVLADLRDPNVPSIASVYQGADWHERECFDFFGIHFSGHPNLLPLLLDPEGESSVLLKDEKTRGDIRSMMSSGEVIFLKEGFNLLENPAADEGDAQ